MLPVWIMSGHEFLRTVSRVGPIVVFAVSAGLFSVGAMAQDTGSSGTETTVDEQATTTEGPGETTPPPAAEQAATNEPPGLTEAQQRQLDLCTPTILNPSADVTADTRRLAIEQLLTMDVPQVNDVLSQALRSGNPHVLRPVLDVLRVEATPIEALIPALVDALRTNEEASRDALLRVITKYGDASLEAISALVFDQSVPAEERVGPIAALGLFQTREVAGQLIALLDAERNEPEPILGATCTALERLTGLEHGTNVEAWNAWWSGAKSMSALQWQLSIVDQLNQKIAELQRSLDDRQGRTAETEARLLRALRDSFRHLPVEKHKETLLALLDEPLRTSRQAALERLERVLRDQPIEEDLQQRLAQCIDDPEPSLRLRAAQLLHRLNYPAAGTLLAQRLSREQDRDVANGLILLIEEHPTAESVAPLAARLSDPSLVDAAANALWKILTNPAINQQTTDEQRITAVQSAKQAYEQHQIPPVIRLVALLDSNDELQRLVPFLDDDQAAVRSAVAAGFAARGLTDPLVERVADPTVYPFAVSAVSNLPADLAQLRRLVEMSPPNEETIVPWHQAIENLARKLPSAQLVEADDLLASYTIDFMALRLSILNRYAQRAEQEADAAVRVRNISRLSELLVVQQDVGRAFALLQALNGLGTSPEFLGQKFRTALLAGEYDIAMQIHGAPEPWVTFLDSCADQPVNVCQAVREEIANRFNGQLEGAVLEQYQMICQRLDGDTNG